MGTRLRTGALMPLLVLCVLQAFSTEGLVSEMMGNITFECPDGYQIKGPDCYLLVNSPMKRQLAAKLCEAHGASLVEIRDEVEGKDVGHMVQTRHSSWTNYWVGNVVQDSDSACGWFWAKQEPQDRMANSSLYVAASPPMGRWEGKSMNTRLPFVCRTDASVHGTFRCRDGKKILSNMWKCDGIYDCEDQSDESNCAITSCTYYRYEATGTLTVDSALYKAGKTCTWYIEGPPEKLLAITFQSLDLEADVDYVEVWSGSPSLLTSKLQARLTGSLTNRKVYGCNNFLIVKLVADLTVEKAGFTASWAPGNELSYQVQNITASDDWVELTSPSYSSSSNILPVAYDRQYTVSTDPDSVITMEVLENGLGDGFEYDPNTLSNINGPNVSPDTYVSLYNTFTFYLSSDCDETGRPRKFKARVKKGCALNITSTNGNILPPLNKERSNYLALLTCTYAIYSPVQQGFKVKFPTFQLPDAKDAVKVYNGADSSAAELTPKGGYTGVSPPSAGTALTATAPVIYITFRSSRVQTNGDFSVSYNLACPPIANTENMTLSSSDLSFGSEVTLNCVKGFAFEQEEYVDHPSMNVTCGLEGKWNVSRLPTCAGIYCGVPPSIPNGFIMSGSGDSKYGATVAYQCFEGFNISGSNVSTCGDGSKWSTLPVCQTLDCGPPPSLSDGTLNTTNGNGTDFGSVVQYSCNAGYGLIGYSFTVCRKDGTWSKQAPACQRLRCPVPEVDSRVAKLGTSDPVDFEGTLTVSCGTGYVINGTKLSSKTYTCPHSTDFGISYDVCVDLVECENQSSCTGAHERCKNTIGSFTCVCEDNYRRNGNVCEVINRCTEKGTEKASGCDDKNGFCQAMNGGLDYECKCNPGYTLFTQNGISGRYIPSAEDGTRPGDLYYLNHTCVPKTCSQPPNISDGEALTTQSSFDYGETVEYRCNFGYELVRKQPSDNMLTCQGNDTWDKPAPQCRRQSCEALTATGLVSDIYPNSTTYPGNKVELECRSESTDTSYNKTLFCAYDRENNTFRLQGDKPHCPAINCGDPQMTGGANFTAPSSKGLGSSFVFDCTPGFRKEGTSTGGNDTVTCEKNGRWGLGNLTCVGTRCKDPGTPGGMNQTSAKFEAGGNVKYSCHRPGFDPYPAVRTCVFNSTSNMTDWNGMVPVCKDVTKPVFNNCPAQPVKLKLYSNPKTGIDTINATDNSGFVKMTVSPKYFNSDVALDHGNHTVTYTATDAVGNYETCVFTVVVNNDPANLPELSCKKNVTVKVNSTASYSVDLRTEVSTDSDSKLSFSPDSMVTVGPTTVGKTAYRVTATNTFGFQRQCAFIVDVRPNVCLSIYIRSDIASKNALVACSSESGDMNCTVTCNSSFAFQDGSTSMDYGCTGSNTWTPSLPPRSCVAIKNSDHEYAVDVTYNSTNFPVENCKDALQKKLTEQIPQQTVTGCTVNQGDTLTFDFVKSEIIDLDVDLMVVRVFLSVSNSSRVSTATCASRLGNSTQTSDLFDVSGTSFKCGEDNFTFTRTAQSVNSSGPTCSTGRVLVSIGSKNRCVSCEPGFYFKDKACSKCENGQYQNLAGETQCKRCGDALYSNEPRVAFSQCVASCPVGFYNGEAQSANPAGCISCAENTFLATLYTATCRSCLGDATTLAFQGATQCTDKCAAGRYPVNNTVCAPCPRGYYKIIVGNTACTPCDLNQTTLTEGADESTDCVAVNQTLTCQNNGSGQIDYHVNVCGCPAGYSGETCQQPVDACDSSPCYNGGTCASSSPDSYQCTCRIKEDCKMDKNDIKYDISKDPLELRQNVVNVTDCQKLCIDNKECAVILYYNTLKYCLLYNATEYVNGTTVNGKGYIKSCLQTELFGGSQCEIDKEKNCKNDTCAEESFCRELIGGADCVCPSESKYRAPRCDLDLNVCDNKACFNGAKCIDSGNGVRATCVCLPGFTGEKCEKNIAECKENPAGCLYNGTCKDGNGTYTCDCPLNFSGDHCQNKPNFCKIQNTCANGVCYNDYNISSAVCVCEFPYKLGSDGNCVAQDLCSESNPCQNGSTCDNGAAGKTSCRCLTGYSGSLCQHNIDDCASNPCVNGECTDLVNNYTCICHPGYEGANCENNTNDCLTANCDGNNTVGCDDLLMDFKCKCKVGFTGKRCESNINECLSLPCQHNGTCTDSSTPGNYSCSCQDGWLGKDCEELPGFCSPLPCKNSGGCLSVQDDFVCNCGDGTFGKTCETTTKLCDILNPCTNASFCMNTKGTAVCQCPKDYNGGSCHLREDGCSNSPCQNRGTCVLQEMGRTCECAEGFSGDNCTVEASPCGSTTCPSDATCIVENLNPLCLCGVNKLKTGSTCKVASTDYDICFKTRGEAIRSYQPFKLTNPSLSVIIWVAPVEDTNDTFFQIKLRSNGSSVLTLAKDSVVFGSESPVSIKSAIAKVDLNKWNQLTVTWTSSGSYQVFLDGVNLPGGMTDGTFPPLGEYLYTHIGYNMKGCISQASVWQSVMSFTDSLANYGTPRSLKDPGNLVHGWGGNQVIMDSQQTTVVTPSMAARSRAACAGGRFGSDCSGLEPDKDPPMMTACPEKETFFGSVTRLVQITDRYKSDGTTTNLDCTLLTFGAHSVVFMASDVINNVAFCRFRAYVRRPGQSCGNTKGLNSSLLAPCGTVGQKVQCPNKGLAPLSPRIVTCGQLGSYNLDQPHQLPPAIVCGDMGEKNNKITSTLKYGLLIQCDSNSEDAVEIALKLKVVALQKTWLHLCPDNTCTNVDISAKCESFNQKNVTATITMDAVPPTLKNSMTNVTLTAQEFIEHATLELLSFNITAVSGAKFQAESATIKVVPSCASGYGLHGDKCVRCTQGSFLDNSTGMCKLCPIGRYTSTDLETQCMKCAEGKTTLQLGATSCKKNCNPGEFLNMTSDQCDPCPKNFYQNEPGQIYCLPCPACKATKSTGANNASLCFVVCPSGQFLVDSLNTCKKCAKGTYQVDAGKTSCQSCPANYTTANEESKLATDCFNTYRNYGINTNKLWKQSTVGAIKC
ncbi:hypothetical protein ACOMHN_034550 [Nucella lapillus]